MSEPEDTTDRSVDVRCEDGKVQIGVFTGDDCHELIPFESTEALLRFEAALHEAIQQHLTPPEERRWACPACKGRNVQISFPAWYYESKDFNLAYYEVDSEADIQWWYCEDCGETDNGAPTDLMEGE